MSERDTETLLVRIDERVARLERELLGNGQPGRCAYHSRRLLKLEQWRAWMAGAIAAIGTMLAILGGKDALGAWLR